MNRFLQLHYEILKQIEINHRWSKQGWMKNMGRVKMRKRRRRKEQEMILELETGVAPSGARMGSFTRFQALSSESVKLLFAGCDREH